jgi:hypothetical protein
MVALEDHIQEVVVLDVLDPVCVHKLISDEIKTWTIDFEESQYCCGQVSSNDGATVKWLPVKRPNRLVWWCVAVLCDL